MEKKELTFKVTQNLALSNSFGTIATENGVLLTCTIWLIDKYRGAFEFYDDESGGNNWYASGSLSFRGNYLVDYDGCFNLPDFITNKLEEEGFRINL